MAELTNEQIQERFLSHVRRLVDYWSTQPDETTWFCVSGVAFSILAMLDGCVADLPAFLLAPAPHPGDKAYHQARGEDWYPETSSIPSDISGVLHDRFYMYRS